MIALVHVDQLIAHPASGSRPPELPGYRHRHRQIEFPWRVIYRHDNEKIYVLCVMRGERPLTKAALKKRNVLPARVSADRAHIDWVNVRQSDRETASCGDIFSPANKAREAFNSRALIVKNSLI